MTNIDLARDYMIKALNRQEILDLLLRKNDFSDVIREAQEIVELSQKAMLRQVGIDPPKWHDVGMIIIEHKEKFPEEVQESLHEIAEISRWLRKERELAFYGDIDFIPSEEYTREDALRAIDGARRVIEVASKVVLPSKA
jgi:HEPN domain-containing protein